jgi:hypothetical protein
MIQYQHRSHSFDLSIHFVSRPQILSMKTCLPTPGGSLEETFALERNKDSVED